MTRAHLYTTSWNTMGGGEKYLCAMAQVLALTGTYEVTLLVDRPEVTRERLQRFFNLPLERVTIRAIRRRSARSALNDAGLAVLMSNVRPFLLTADRSVYVVQIPYGAFGAGRLVKRLRRGERREAVKDLSRLALLREARRADLVLVYSSFVAETLRRHHGIAAEVLHPPIDDFALRIPRERVILSVGRFFTGLYNDKRFDVLVEAFKRLRALLPHTSWQYWLAGSCAADEMSQRTLGALRRAARGHQIYFRVNIPYDELRRVYNQASLFWHAAGYGVDEELEPERVEHFGMTTVEAMTASCVPLVTDRGGQREIVVPDRSGILWTRIDELVEQTAALISDPARMRELGAGARARSQEFAFSRFASRLVALLSTSRGQRP